jgi:hypothetical protein
MRNCSESPFPAIPKKGEYAERFAREALGHKSKAVHPAYAKRALTKIPSLEEYEVRATLKPAVAIRLNGGDKRSFLVRAVFRLGHRSIRTCSFAKNPRSGRLHYFFKRSNVWQPSGLVRRQVLRDDLPLLRRC